MNNAVPAVGWKPLRKVFPGKPEKHLSVQIFGIGRFAGDSFESR
jgi:hypothetical protein